jgi:hypothetical protein
MKDGDVNQAAELRSAMKEYFPNSIEAGCGYHIVQMGSNRHIPNARTLRKSCQAKFLREVRKIHNWLYSFMRPGFCQSKQEYELSKYLLLQYVTSEHFLRVVGGINYEFMIRALVKWLRSYVYPNEDLYLAYKRKNIMHMDISHSSAQEGTHFGLKEHAARVTPQLGVDKAAAAMGIQDSCKATECDLIVGRDLLSSDKSSWTSNPCAPKLLTFAAGLMEYWFSQSKHYLVRRVGRNKFLVVYVGKGCDPKFVAHYISGWTPPAEEAANSKNEDTTFHGEEDAFEMSSECKHPLFSHAYVVVLDEHCSTCSCCHFERIGLPCPHLNACCREVLKTMGIQFHGFDEKSVKLRWTTAYMYYGYRSVESPEEKKLVQELAQLAMCENANNVGPKFSHDLPDEATMPILSDISELPIADRLKNYPKEVIPENFSDMFDSLFSSTHIPHASQQLEEELFGGGDDDDDDDDDDEEEEEHLTQAIANLRAHRHSALEDFFSAADVDGNCNTKMLDGMKGTDYRSALVGRFNEAASLIQQIGDPSLAEEMEEELLNPFIDKLHKICRERDNEREKKRKGTSPKENGKKKSQKIVPITSVKHTGAKDRLHVAKNAMHRK